MSQDRLSRREMLTLASLGVVGYSMSGWLGALAEAAVAPRRKRSCILLWMNGGPSQMDTFDLKPGHANGGPVKEIQTSAPGLKISEHLREVAKFGHKMAVVRSMSTREGDHGRATFLMRTGYMPQASLAYPTLGSLLSKELGRDDAPLPNFVSIAPYRAFSPAAFTAGFLGPQHGPLVIGENVGFVRPGVGAVNYDDALKVRDLTPPAGVPTSHLDARIDLLRGLERDFVADRPDVPPTSHRSAYERAVRMMRGEAGRAFNLEEEPARVRDAYGRNLFGQGCLLARRLVERGVPFVEITLSSVNGMPGALGWDTHGNNFAVVQQLCGVLDPAWGNLMKDLQDRGLLDSTLILWMGEFGRTPVINRGNGRDHYPNAWSAVMAGGGIKGGQAVGKTSADGTTVTERPTSIADFIATVCLALGLDPEKQNLAGNGRPIRLADKVAKPIREIVG